MLGAMHGLQAIGMFLFDHAGWEAVCDRCGRCCFEREIDPDGDVVIDYAAPCEFLEVGTRRCREYDRRFRVCNRCRRLTPLHALVGRYLPPECAYVRRFRG